jgi:hypothetical protein
MIQNTHELPYSEFPNFAADLREELHSKPRFTLPMSGGSADITFYTVRGEYQGAKLAMSNAPELTFQHGPIAIEDFGQYGKNWGLPPLPGRETKGIAEVIDADTAAKLVKDAQGNIIFYTGAGISNAGDMPVYDHATLERRLGFVDEEFAHDYYGDAKTTNDWFVDVFLTNPGRRDEVAETYNDFLGNMVARSTTVAHVAIRHIIEKNDHTPYVLTSNYDCKHEASGIEAIKVPAGWHHETGSPMGDKARIAIEEIAARTGSGLLIVAGVSRDSRGVLELLKEARPELTMLAVNERPTSELRYVGEGDYHLDGDAQQTLPLLAAFS